MPGSTACRFGNPASCTGFRSSHRRSKTGRVRIALSRLTKASLFSGDPNVFLNAKSLVGRIPIGCMWQSLFYAKRCFPRVHRSDDRSQTNDTTNPSSVWSSLCELGALARNPLLAVPGSSRVPASHRKGAKDAKGDSQASKTTVPFVSSHCDLQHGSAAI